MSAHFLLIVGEWGIDPISKKAASYSSEEKKVFYQQLSHAQLKAWQNAACWFFWSYKLHVDAPGFDGWDMGKAMELGYFQKQLRGDKTKWA